MVRLTFLILIIVNLVLISPTKKNAQEINAQEGFDFLNQCPFGCNTTTASTTLSSTSASTTSTTSTTNTTSTTTSTTTTSTTTTSTTTSTTTTTKTTTTSTTTSTTTTSTTTTTTTRTRKPITFTTTFTSTGPEKTELVILTETLLPEHCGFESCFENCPFIDVPVPRSHCRKRSESGFCAHCHRRARECLCKPRRNHECQVCRKVDCACNDISRVFVLPEATNCLRCPVSTATIPLCGVCPMAPVTVTVLPIVPINVCPAPSSTITVGPQLICTTIHICATTFISGSVISIQTQIN